MATKTTRHELSDFSAVLHVAIDLGSTTWKLVSGVPGKRARCQTIKAGDLPAFQEELLRAKVRFDLSAEADVVSCYEAGRDGFWLHRYLERAGVRSLVIDPASCEVDRRAKQRKTDRLDGEKMLDLLIRHFTGPRSPLRVVVVPPEEIEDDRRLVRERQRLVKEVRKWWLQPWIQRAVLH